MIAIESGDCELSRYGEPRCGIRFDTLESETLVGHSENCSPCILDKEQWSTLRVFVCYGREEFMIFEERTGCSVPWAPCVCRGA